MKTPFDPRHQKRKKTVQALFTWGFRRGQVHDELAKKIIANLSEIDDLIGECAPEWPLEQINKIDLAILRLALYELTVARAEPIKVIIDEAVELAKEFGSQASASFINGVLGNIVKKRKLV